MRGHSDAETYARNYNRYAQAMRAVDPSIKLIAVGDNDMNWNRTVLREARRNVDYLAIHHYYGRRELRGDPSNLMAHPLSFEHFYRQVQELLTELGLAGHVKLSINEWGLDLPTEQQYSIESALYGARLMNVFERSGEIVAMSAVSDLVNGWPGGIIQAGRDSVFVSPIYLVNELYAEHRGDMLLATRVDSPTFNTSREGTNIPYLDATASRTADGKMVFIKAVNTDKWHALSATIVIRGAATIQKPGTMETIGGDINVANSFRTPRAISISRTQLPPGETFRVILPKASVSVMVLNF